MYMYTNYGDFFKNQFIFSINTFALIDFTLFLNVCHNFSFMIHDFQILGYIDTIMANLKIHAHGCILPVVNIS